TDNIHRLSVGFRQFAKEYKQLEKKGEQTIEQEVNALLEQAPPVFEKNGNLIENVKKQIDTIYAPTLVVQGRKDEMINTESANYIYDHVEATEKQLNWYEESGHVITFDK